MSTSLNDTIKVAKGILSSASGGAEHAAASARTTWVDGIKAVGGVLSTLRSLQPDDALGWAGLERRRSPLANIGLLGVGIALGAGAGMLLAPTSGVELRRRLVSLFTGLDEDVKREGKKVAAKVEASAGKAADAEAPAVKESPRAARPQNGTWAGNGHRQNRPTGA
jgi:hypothetical protein